MIIEAVRQVKKKAKNVDGKKCLCTIQFEASRVALVFEHTTMPFILSNYSVLFQKKIPFYQPTLYIETSDVLSNITLGLWHNHYISIQQLAHRYVGCWVFFEEGADAVCSLKEPELNVTYSVIKEEKRYALLSAESTELMALKATSWPLYHQAHDRPLSYLQLFNSMALEWRISTTKCQCVPLTIFGKA